MNQVARIVLRSGSSGDIEAAVVIHRLANDARQSGRSTASQQEVRVRAPLNAPDAFLAIAEVDGKPVGMANAMQGLADDGAGPPMPGVRFFSMVYVLPEHWKEGVGGRLVDALLDEASTRGYVRVQLWPHAANDRAQRLYEGRGFVRTGREKNNDKGEQIVLYERDC